MSFIAEKKYERIFKSYTKLLRTDLDVFISPKILSWRTSKYVVGGGKYVRMDYTREKLYTIANELGLRNQKIHNTGSTWYGEPELTIALTKKAMKIGDHILRLHFNRTEKQGWPIWHRGVTSMYAQELALNDILDRSEFIVTPTSLDAMSNMKILVNDVYHIHCWYRGEHIKGTHSEFFWKEDFFKGMYTTDKYPKHSLNMSLVSDYSLSLVLYGA